MDGRGLNAYPLAAANALAGYDFSAEVYGTLSLASRMASTMKNRANVLRLAYNLHNVNRKLQSLFDTVDEAVTGKRQPAQTKNQEPPTPARLRASADSLEELARTIDYVLEASRRVGLCNNSLTAGPLRKFKAYRERLVDLADWLELIAEPKATAELFARAAQERERGEMFDLQP
jgi:hypothetical protein